MYKIINAIQKGISKGLGFNIEDSNSDFSIKKSKVHSQSQVQYLYEYAINDKLFQKCVDLYYDTKEKYIVYNVNDLKQLVSNFNDEEYDGFNLNWIDTSRIDTFEGLFYDYEYFNCDISEWDTSNVRSLKATFRNCYDFNQPLDKWDVSNVEDMDYTFYMCSSFNQPLNSWNISKVNRLGVTFCGCKKFNQPLDKWDVSHVNDMSGTFYKCYSFCQDLTSWNLPYDVEFVGSAFKETKMTIDLLPKINKKWDI